MKRCLISKKRQNSIKLISSVIVMSVISIHLIQCASSTAGAQELSFTITDLKVQHTIEPLAIEDQHPVFSWQMRSSAVGQEQGAYQIVVTRESDGTVV